MFGRADDGVASDFGAGASRGGHGEERQWRLFEGTRLTDDFQVIKRLAGIGRNGCDGFGGIDGTAAAEADDEVGEASCLGTFANGGNGGFAFDAEKAASDAG